MVNLDVKIGVPVDSLLQLALFSLLRWPTHVIELMHFDWIKQLHRFYWFSAYIGIIFGILDFYLDLFNI